MGKKKKVSLPGKRESNRGQRNGPRAQRLAKGQLPFRVFFIRPRQLGKLTVRSSVRNRDVRGEAARDGVVMMGVVMAGHAPGIASVPEESAGVDSRSLGSPNVAGPSQSVRSTSAGLLVWASSILNGLSRNSVGRLRLGCVPDLKIAILGWSGNFWFGGRLATACAFGFGFL